MAVFWHRVGLCLLFCGVIGQLPAQEEDPLVELQERIVTIQQEHAPAVVTVFAQHRPADPEQPASHFVGTGFFISREGLILTATNVVFGADRVWVENDGAGYLAEVVGADRLTNVAILRLLAVPENLTFLRFPEEPQLPAVGSLLVSISSELGMAPGPEFGLVSGRNTTYGERVLPTIYLRTTLALNGGENGAPVFDLNGNLIGMAIIGLPETRSSFVLPVRALERVRDDVLFSGEVTFAHFGFTTLELRDPAQASRVVVEGVEPGGPAEAAGVEPNDIILRLGPFDIRRDDDLRRAFFFTRPDERVDLVVLRDGKKRTLMLKAGRRERPPTAVELSPRDSLKLPDGSVPPGETTPAESEAASVETAEPTVETPTDVPANTPEESAPLEPREGVNGTPEEDGSGR
ncbi:MAG: S1C family serine protease [Opitutales bacterium]